MNSWKLLMPKTTAPTGLRRKTPSKFFGTATSRTFPNWPNNCRSLPYAKHSHDSGELGESQILYYPRLEVRVSSDILGRERPGKTSFSVNGGKYEFCRLPFGLKNAGSVFQRAIGDVLREEIGKICYVYVDDVIIFSENETEHVRHIDIVLKRLLDANMKVAREKTKFFKESV